MSAQRVIWLILPVVLIALSLWLIAVRAPASRLPLGLIVVFCIIGCIRQAFLFWGKGQKPYAYVTIAGIIISFVALVVTSFRF